MSFNDMCLQSGIPPHELQRAVSGLTAAKSNLLIKIGTTDNSELAYAFNVNFSSKMARIKVAHVVGVKESMVERSATSDKIEEDRNIQIEACIVSSVNAMVVRVALLKHD